MATPIYNTTDSINESASLHSAIDKFLQLGDVVPAANIIQLKLFDPVKHTSNPLQLFVLIAITNGVWMLTEVNVGVPA